MPATSRRGKNPDIPIGYAANRPQPRWHRRCLATGIRVTKGPAMITKAGTRIVFAALWAALAAALLLSPANAAELVKIKLAEVVRSQFYVPMYVAINKGFLKAEGLEVELVTNNGGDRTGAIVLS